MSRKNPGFISGTLCSIIPENTHMATLAGRDYFLKLQKCLHL